MSEKTEQKSAEKIPARIENHPEKVSGPQPTREAIRVDEIKKTKE